MKKAAVILLSALLLLGALAFEGTGSSQPASSLSGSGGFYQPPYIPIITPKPTIDLGDRTFLLPTIKIMLPTPGLPAATPVPPADTPPPAATPKPTRKPAPKPPAGDIKGAEMTSFGLYFEDLRPKLTDKWYLFTPLDLSVEGSLSYPLVAENAHIIGAVHVTVAGGQVTVNIQPLAGVAVSRAFHTLVPSLDSLQTLNPGLLGPGLPNNTPLSIEGTFGADRKVVLYVNYQVDFQNSLAGVTPFVPEQHQLFMQNLLPLVD